MSELVQLRLDGEAEFAWYALGRVVERPLGCGRCHHRIGPGEAHARGHADGRRVCADCVAAAERGGTMTPTEANRRQRRDKLQWASERGVRMLLDGLEVGSITELKRLVDDARALRVELERQQEMWSTQSRIIGALAAEVPDDVRARVLAAAFRPTTEGEHDGT